MNQSESEPESEPERVNQSIRKVTRLGTKDWKIELYCHSHMHSHSHSLTHTHTLSLSLALLNTHTHSHSHRNQNKHFLVEDNPKSICLAKSAAGLLLRPPTMRGSHTIPFTFTYNTHACYVHSHREETRILSLSHESNQRTHHNHNMCIRKKSVVCLFVRQTYA
jgi:hypothetical protein